MLLDACMACGPASQAQIEAAQYELDLFFPPSYRFFLETYGAVFGHGLAIAGLTPHLGEEPPMWPDMLSSTLMYRRHNALPDKSIYISTDGTDLSYFLRCSGTDPTLEGAVIEWGPDHGGGIVFADSFDTFIARWLDR